MKKMFKYVMKMIKKINCKFFHRLIEDIHSYDKYNSSEEKVFDAWLFSCYKKVVIIKLPIGYNAASYGIIVMGNKIKNINTLKHEYGHRLQLNKMGALRYTFKVAIPSVMCFLLLKKMARYDIIRAVNVVKGNSDGST